MDVGHLNSTSSVFPKSSLYIWEFLLESTAETYLEGFWALSCGNVCYLCSPSRWSFQCPDWLSWSSNEKKQNMITDTSHSVFPVVLDHSSLPGCISHSVIPVKSRLSGKACCSTVKMPHKTKSSLSSPAAWYISNRMTLVLYAWKSCIQDFTHSPLDVSGPTKSEWK